jgi:hypothetical protein
MREAAKLGIKPKWLKAVPDKNPRVSASMSIISMCEQSLKHDIPLLFLEDDISLWNQKPLFDVPSDADILRLGNSTYFLDRKGRTTQTPDSGAMQQTSDDLFRVSGMLATHAMIFITKKAKQSFLDSCRAVVNNILPIYDMQLSLDTYDTLVCYSTVWPTFY